MGAIIPKGWHEREDRRPLTDSVHTAIGVGRFLRGDPMTASDAAIERAFAAARGPRGKKAACDEVRRLFPAALKRQIKCSAKFIHFDSGNITHAGAIYEVTLRGTTAAINAAGKYLINY